MQRSAVRGSAGTTDCREAHVSTLKRVLYTHTRTRTAPSLQSGVQDDELGCIAAFAPSPFATFSFVYSSASNSI